MQDFLQEVMNRILLSSQNATLKYIDRGILCDLYAQHKLITN